MSDNKKKEVIKNLKNTIKLEKSKDGGGNPKIIEDLSKVLESIEDGTYVSKAAKRKK